MNNFFSRKKDKLFSLTVGLVMTVMTLILLLSSLQFMRDPAPGGARGVTRIENVAVTVDGVRTEMTLPADIRGYDPGTMVLVSFDVNPKWGDTLYVRSIYSFLDVSLDGNVIYRYGMKGTYPGFMADPPISSKFISIGGTKKTGHVTLTYVMPESKDELELKAPLVSNSSGLLRFLFTRNLSSLALSAFLLVATFVLMLLFLTVVFFEKEGIIFLRLAAFCALTAIWNIGDCEISVFIIKSPMILYLMTFMGIISAAIPLHNLLLQIVNVHKRNWVIMARRTLSVLVMLAIAGQLSGLVMLHRSVYFFMVVLTVDLLFLFGVSLYEYLKFGDHYGRPMCIAMGILIAATILESYNYGYRLNTNMAIFLQCGIALFICVIAVLSGTFYRDSIRIRKMEEKQKLDVTLMQMRLEHEKKHAEIVIENEKILRKQRHDFRHHLMVLKNLNENGERETLTEYLDEMISDMTPVTMSENYCDNRAVNAVVSGFAAQASRAGVECDILLEVPDHTSRLNDVELCEVFGNLLENAVEACGRMTEGKKFITMRSRLHFENLIITMDNSFDGTVRMMGNEYMSSKRNGAGIGVKSIQSVAKKNNGKADFSSGNGVFHSSILLHI